MVVVYKFSGLLSVFGKVLEYCDFLISCVNIVYFIVIVVYWLDMAILGILVLVFNKDSYCYIFK